ncbi:type II toxin-antitoxin system PemK/MazF family toxin [Clostridium beijerinckii]|uniref:mRNA interferase n=1 Tax=Clostridium beijerinckii TaxID=1520 RepID=A0A1S8S743_CLOBE|nr:type II toxin-antitoxin system PemK/MazF family toxin [Clostridium beijerinckii]NRY61494.1 mRNA interferase MazF [Clostridium beijerinckii]OOM61281.1 mRNA interferase endoA [Clostridium beijerinckii]
MKIYRNSIIMVDFGELQGSVQKGIRPGVVIQNDIGNKYSTTTIVVPITGRIKKTLPTHHELSSKNYCCLKCDSTILAEQVITISKEQILDIIGHLRDEDEFKLNEILAISMNIKTTEI